MAEQILVNPSDLKTKSNQVKQYKENHHDIMNKITNLVMTLGEVWQGDAQNAFVSKYLSMQSVYDSFEDALEEFADLMEKVADEMQKADQAGKNIINSIY